MSDHSLRSLERSRGISPAGSAAYLTAWMRAGGGCERCGHFKGWCPNPQPGVVYDYPGSWCRSCAGTGSTRRARVEMAAYCGDEGALLVASPHSLANAGLGYAHQPTWTHPHPHKQAFPDWLSGLSRWSDIGPAPGWVLVRAAAAAARVALTALRCGDPHSNHPDWQAPPGHRADACATGAPPRRAIEAAEAWLECPCTKHTRYLDDACSVLGPGLRFASSLGHVLRPHARGHYVQDVTEDAARLAGEAPVREAIRTALVSWALEDRTSPRTSFDT